MPLNDVNMNIFACIRRQREINVGQIYIYIHVQIYLIFIFQDVLHISKPNIYSPNTIKHHSELTTPSLSISELEMRSSFRAGSDYYRLWTRLVLNISKLSGRKLGWPRKSIENFYVKFRTRTSFKLTSRDSRIRTRKIRHYCMIQCLMHSRIYVFFFLFTTGPIFAFI